MNKKALSLAITLAMAFPAASHALGLGDIQSNSHLNQPFRGKIPVLSATPAEAKNLHVKIASPAVFNRVGIDRPAFLNSIRFRPVIENGKPVILVSSTQPIHEPFVNFLLEVNWAKGQLLKEYTALLDPPVLMQPGTAVANNRVGVRAEPGAQRRVNRPAAQQQPRRAQPQRRIVRAPAPRRAAPPRQRQLTELQRAAQALGVAGNRTAARATPSRGTKTYRVKRGDYLYKVAKKLGYRGVRNEQMMMALFEANPQAFHGNNVNNLKAGALMRRPTAQQARGITYRTAKKRLVAHTKTWKKNTQVAGKTASKNRVAANSKATSSSNTQAHMVVSGSDGAKVNGLSAAGNATVSELKQKLVLASESLTSKSSENSELKSRVAELESLLRKKNRLITLKSEQLAELQARVGGEEVSPSAETETEIVQPQTNIENPISTEVNGGEGEDIQAQVANQTANEDGQIIRTEAPEPAVVPEEEPPIAKTTPKPIPQQADGGILGLLGDPMVTGIGGGSLLALLGGLWFMRRRKKGDVDDEEYSDFSLDEELAKSADIGSEDLGLDQTEMDNGDFTEADFGVEEGMFGEEVAQKPEATPEEEISGESKEENILQEADVYLVYGLHDQAEAELRKAIEEEPNNLAYRAKLIENFKAAGDKKNFEKEVKAFKELEGDDKESLWKDISSWGKSLIPDSNLFSSSSAAVAGAAVAAGVAVTAGSATPEENVDVDFSSGVENEIESMVDTGELEELDSVLDDDFSIDIDDMLDDEIVTKDTVSEVTEEAIDGLDMNFDNSMTDLNVNQVADDVIESDISDSLDLDLGLTDAADDLSEEVQEVVDLDSALDISNFETDLGSEAISTEAEKVEETVDGLDLDFDLGLDDGIDDKVASAKENVSEAVDDKLEMPNLNLDIDANDFDKIMPENHAYKKVEEVAEKATEAEDNLLADFDDNLSFLDLEEDSGEVIEETQIGTKLDLAKAYIDMGDIEGARSTLEEVMMEGNDEQKKEAEELLHQTG